MKTSNSFSRVPTSVVVLVAFLVAMAGLAPAGAQRPAERASSAHPKKAVPQVVGRPVAGAKLTCKPAARDRKVRNLKYSWRQDGNRMAGQRKAKLKVTDHSTGHTIACATKVPGAARAVASAPVVVVSAPSNTVLPTLTGSGAPGDTLSCAPGTWAGDPTFVYAWTRNGSPLGISAATYAPAETDAGTTVVCLVTGQNAVGASGAVASNAITVGTVGAPAGPTSAPTNSVVPHVTGTGHPGDALTCAPGAWAGAPVLTYSWTRNGSPTGVTTGTLTPAVGDLGATYVCLVVGTNAAGASGAVASPGVTVTSAGGPGGPAPTTAPMNTSAPSVTGVPNPGQSLTCAPGTWTDDSDLSYAWTRNGSPAGTSPTYRVGSGAAGDVIACLVRGSNTVGTSGYATSPTVTIEMPAPPVQVTAPTLAGTAVSGATLVCSTGIFSHYPLTYTVTFTRDGADLASSTLTAPGTATYTVLTGDVGHSLQCSVRASNASGTSPAATTTDVVPVPTNLTAPTITGIPKTGQTLTCTTGTWDAATSYTYVWTRAGTTDPVSTTSTYDAVAADAAATLTCAVTATILAGTSAPASSAAVAITTPVAVTAAGTIFAGATSNAGFALKNGAVYAWGNNSYSQLGDGTTSNRTKPVAVATAGTPMAGKTIVAVSSASHTVALDSEGAVYTWGRNNYGQLGNGSTSNSSLPVAVVTAGTPMAGKAIKAVAAGSQFTVALATDGTVYAWGLNSSGQLGNGSTSNSSLPVAVVTAGTSMAGKTVTAVGAGNATIAVDAVGSVYAWGPNSNGELGNGSTVNSSLPVAVVTAGTPMAGKTITAVAAGLYFTTALATDGSVYTWGSNAFGQLGNGTAVSVALTPTAVQMAGTALEGRTVTAIASGAYHVLALTADARLVAWGYGGSGGLGDSTTSWTSSSAVAVTTTGALAGKTITGIAGGFFHSLATTSEGSFYAWGDNSNGGQLGTGDNSSANAPVAVNAAGTPLAP